MAQPSARRREAPLLVPAEIRTVESRPDAPSRRWFRLTTAISADRLALRNPLPLERGARVMVGIALPPPDLDAPVPRIELPGVTDAGGRDDGRAGAITFARLDETARAVLEAYLAERLGPNE